MLKQLILSDYVEQFIFDRTSRGRSSKTIIYYSKELDYFLKFLASHNVISLDQLSANILRMWFTDLRSHRNTGGVHANFRAVKSFMNWLWDEEDLDIKNPINKMRIESNRIEPLPEIPLEVVRELLESCKAGNNSLRDIAIIQTLVDTGARASELLSLNIEDVGEDGSVIIHHGKGNKSRVVWMGRNSTRVLKEYLATRTDAKHSDPLFISTRNTRIKFFGLREIISRLCKRADVPIYGIHSFRRLFALSLFRQTNNIYLVSKLLGHSDLVVTTRYLNVGNADLKSQHNKHSPADLL